LQDDQWHHVAVVRNDTTDQVTVYIDGVTVGTHAVTLGALTIDAGGLVVGQEQDSVGGGFDLSQEFDGLLDELQFHRRVLTATEIANLYAGQSRDTDTFVDTPIASYKAEGNGNDFQSTHEGTASGGVTYSAGITGQGFNFEGTGKISIPDSGVFNAGAALTVSAWVNPDVISNNREIVSQWNATTGQRGFDLRIDSTGHAAFFISKDGNVDVASAVSSATLSTGHWTHVTGTYDGSNIRIYVDGVLSGTTAYAGTMFNSTDPVLIGDSNSNSKLAFDGKIDEVAIYNRVLSGTEVGTLFSSVNQSTVSNQIGVMIDGSAGNTIGGSTISDRNVISGNNAHGVYISGNGVPNDAVAWWKADGTSNDSVGANNGTLTNGATISAGGVSGSSFHFDGVDDFVSIADNPDLSITGSLTVEAWINVESLPTGWAPIINKWQDGAGINERGYFITVKPTGQIQFFASADGATMWASAISTSTIELNTWTHVSGVFDSEAQQLRVYIDGQLVGTTATSFTTLFDNAQPLLIGSGKVGGAAQSYFHGSI
ncbi:MAG: LamG domain-containing protein, partial [Planctomycetales bacterium]|nr:LamG domain-containing protein [Planctomycetales bacterium]